MASFSGLLVLSMIRNVVGRFAVPLRGVTIPLVLNPNQDPELPKG